MTDSEDDFLSVDAIEKLARATLPAHYRLIGVRFDHGSASPSLPRSLEIRIEFSNLLDEELQGTPEDIRAHQAWANPLIAKIRTQWPKEAIRISIAEKSASDV